MLMLLHEQLTIHHQATTICEASELCVCVSEVVVCSTGGPRVMMLSSFLFTLFTLDHVCISPPKVR